MNKIFLIISKYSDNSDNGIVKGYRYKSLADKQLSILKQHADSSKIFSIIEIEVL